MIKISAYFIVIMAVTLTLTACSENQTTTSEEPISASGIWTGTLESGTGQLESVHAIFYSESENGNHEGIIYSDNEFAISGTFSSVVYSSANQNNEMVSINTVYQTNGYQFSGHSDGSIINFELVVNHQQIINGRFDSAQNDGRLNLRYQAISNREITEADINGSWVELGTGASVTVEPIDDALEFSSDSLFDCQLTGSISFPELEPEYNVFPVDMALNDCSIEGVFQGFAFVSDRVTEGDNLELTFLLISNEQVLKLNWVRQ